MPELPDITAYLTALDPAHPRPNPRAPPHRQPPAPPHRRPPSGPSKASAVRSLRRIGKRIVFCFDDETKILFLVLHLMIAGRLHWRDNTAKGRPSASTRRPQQPRRLRLPLTAPSSSPKPAPSAAPRLSRAGRRRPRPARPRRHRRPLRYPEAFQQALTAENRTLKRALTDPRVLSGIGNAYSDEILWPPSFRPSAANPQAHAEDQWQRLYAATLRHAAALDRPLQRRSPPGLPGEGHRLPPRDGRARPLRPALPALRLAGTAHPFRRQRNELLPHLPDRRQGPRRPQPLPPARRRLAPHPRISSTLCFVITLSITFSPTRMLTFAVTTPSTISSTVPRSWFLADIF